MPKPQKASTAQRVLFGLGIALLGYLLLLTLLALLMVRSAIPESAMFPAVGVCCGIASLVCGVCCSKCFPMGTLPNALIGSGGFGLILLVIGFFSWDGITWMGHGGILLLCVLLGGILAGLFSNRTGKRQKRRRI